MGQCDSKFKNIQQPNPRDPSVNKCSDALGDIITAETTRICYTPATTGQEGGGPGDEYLISNYCKSIGSGDEWIWQDDGNDEFCCKWDGKILTTDKAECNGCCDGDCVSWLSNAGSGGRCKRIAFTADPVVCCFLDDDCVFQDPSIQDRCWQTDLKDRTCDPEYRDLSGDSCLSLVEPYCTGEKLFLGQENWWDLWVEETKIDINSDNSGLDVQKERKMAQPCLRALARAISKDQQFCTWGKLKNIEFRRGNFDPAGLDWAQNVVDKIFDRYTQEFGSFVGGINRDGKQIDNMLDVFQEICTSFPILCQKPLKDACQNITVDDIVGGTVPRADLWCGCYMPDNQYEKYTNLFQVNRECTPFCNTDLAIPLVDADGYQLYCLTNVCIIDDLKLDFVRDRIRGGSDEKFSLLCGGCGNSSVRTSIQGARDFNTSRDTITGFYSVDLFDTQICTRKSVGRPKEFVDIFGDTNTQTTTTMASVKNGNKINVTVKLNGTQIGNDNEVQYGIQFVSANVTNPSGRFTNAEQISFEGNPIDDCNIFAITVDASANGNDPQSTGGVVRRHEVVENQCTCILEDSTISIVDSEFRNFNLTQNCGTPKCTDKSGNPIPCSSNSTQQNANYYSESQALKWAQNNKKQDKFNTIGIILLCILFLFLILAIGIGMGTSYPTRKS
ncbi:MAG: hypothetical protein S4CHLAM20_14660 [Chlamydiia bacterium]|nr:hypothetical protein [Chlamydiia bacterium]